MGKKSQSRTAAKPAVTTPPTEDPEQTQSGVAGELPDTAPETEGAEPQDTAPEVETDTPETEEGSEGTPDAPEQDSGETADEEPESEPQVQDKEPEAGIAPQSEPSNPPAPEVPEIKEQETLPPEPQIQETLSAPELRIDQGLSVEVRGSNARRHDGVFTSSIQKIVDIQLEEPGAFVKVNSRHATSVLYYLKTVAKSPSVPSIGDDRRKKAVETFRKYNGV